MCYSYNYLDESFENTSIGFFCISYIRQAYFLKAQVTIPPEEIVKANVYIYLLVCILLMHENFRILTHSILYIFRASLSLSPAILKTIGHRNILVSWFHMR